MPPQRKKRAEVYWPNTFRVSIDVKTYCEGSVIIRVETRRQLGRPWSRRYVDCSIDELAAGLALAAKEAETRLTSEAPAAIAERQATLTRLRAGTTTATGRS